MSRAPSAEVPAADVVHLRLVEQVAELLVQEPRVRADLPDGVHKMRVATRRLRSALIAFRPLFDPAATGPLTAELKWLAAVLGNVRDADVQCLRLLQRLDELADSDSDSLLRGQVRARVRSYFDARQQEAHAAAVAALDSERYAVLLERLDDLLIAPPWTQTARRPARVVATRRIHRDWKRLAGEVKALDLGSGDGAPDGRLHDVRKLAKRLRYAAEPLRALYGEEAERFVEAVERIQSVLGEHQDTVAAREVLLDLADRAAAEGDETFIYGVLHERERALAAASEEEFAHLWKALPRKKLRRWLA